CRNAAPQLHFRIALGQAHQHADPPHTLGGLLRARHERPRRRAAEQRDELAPPHSITSSARSKKDSEIVKPSALAAVRLITSSNLVGCLTGNARTPSDGLAIVPLRCAAASARARSIAGREPASFLHPRTSTAASTGAPTRSRAATARPP